MKKTAPSPLKHWLTPALTALVVFFILLGTIVIKKTSPTTGSPESTASATILPAENISLPSPEFRSSNSVEATLKNRRTRRDFQDKELSLKQVSQMLWSAQGVTVDWGGRTAPSAKSTYPLSIFLVASKVTGLEAGEYQYLPGDRTPVHQLKPIQSVELQQALYEALNESSFKKAPAVLVITGNMGKMAEAYGGIGHDKEVYLEAGHVAQSLYLQAESLRLGMVVISSFDELKIKDLVTIPSSDTIIYLIPFGIPKL
ncbi:MAG: Nitroreductase [Candidatus Collierbacteria bacterium GW2011_GWB1_45_35]|uniref:Nitroreductase n=1 Tax=Candidatus Collierbacteria bacterium GW2011_GWB2_45_17 TaxID=1618388 RepID=A0A837III4_9BACT|nr:MAG: Nitroreductase [Microgenomates group bacterium GW2011_GWC1_44_23]KKT95798.1 MAG: Nitroreductase [Candidatus Collierbacteria bacterium GW2011_GWA1_45_15]KKU00258.1 MAG: Nitroreductase [Candidatus Collierbacteria bacterium GW2011_GWB2_45_17]KKU05515.1 MAG: Nitroreductase [Candidatus Collierbacteria bacterium GW2011_GWB1_45_35]KKU08688.1 MAG: Nitroreductase [Candidatus Collierbacteria bacterium GW2011_GWC2_45_40]HCX25296.1 nitroreductase [Candidatus Collierbacteria bacterium]